MIFLVPWVLMFLPVKCTDLDLGNAIDLLQYYGIVGKMLPVADDNYNLFLEKSFSSNVLNMSLPFNKNSRLINKNELSEGIWKLNLCHDAQQLLASFFDAYEVEMVQKAHKLFYSTWTYNKLGTLFGLPHHYLAKDYLFLLIRQEKCIKNYMMKDLPNNETLLNSTFQQQVDKISVEDPLSTYKAFVPFGTHFVKSFSEGDVVFQVLVYPKRASECFITSQHREVIRMIPSCATSSIIKTSSIRSLSNSSFLESKLNEEYNSNSNATANRNSLLHLKLANKYIPEEIYCKLSNMAVIGFNLSSINNVIFNKTKSSFVQEMIDNQMSLRDMFL